MKILLLLSGLLFSGGLFASPMDYECKLRAMDFQSNTEHIKRFCERNNILHMYVIDTDDLIGLIATWCRFDRQVHHQLLDGKYRLTCVLYSNEPRI
jgi:hypothetical protein